MALETGKSKRGEFSNYLDVLAELRTRGIRRSKSQLYNDVASGLLEKQKDGSFYRADVDAYVDGLLGQPGRSVLSGEEQAELNREKTRQEIARLKKQARDMDLDYDLKTGKLCRSIDFYKEITVRTMALKERLLSDVRRDFPLYRTMSEEDFGIAFENYLKDAFHEYSRPPSYETSGVPDAGKALLEALDAQDAGN